MRTRFGTILVAVVVFAVGGVAGWLAAGARGGAAVPSKPSSHVDATLDRARSINTPKGRARRPATADAKSRSKVKGHAEKHQEPVKEAAKPEVKTGPEEQAEQSQEKKDDPFSRYIDMFKNDPEALVAEFLKEAEQDRAFRTKRRQEAIAKLNLNAEQAAVFDRALDELRDEITCQNEEIVDLIKSGQVNEGAEGRIWESNTLLAKKMSAAREAAIIQTAEKLYEQLELDGVSDTDKQTVLYWSANIVSFSYECLEPNLDVYDKVYKNMGVGEGLFSWCKRPHPQEKK